MEENGGFAPEGAVVGGWWLVVGKVKFEGLRARD